MRRKISQQIFIFSLALLVLFNGTGLFVMAYVQTGVHRFEISNLEMQEDSETITVSTAELNSIVWIGKRDFIWKGKVYDLISSSLSDRKINLHCSIDNKENSIRKNLASEFSHEGKNVPASKSARAAFKIFPVLPLADQSAFLPAINTTSILFDQSDPDATISAALSLQSPPPELL